jgi:hypothetical protein
MGCEVKGFFCIDNFCIFYFWRDSSGRDVGKAVIRKGKLDLKRLLPKDSQDFVNPLLWHRPETLNYFPILINRRKLEDLPTSDSPTSKRMACHLLSRGSPGLGAVKEFIQASKWKSKRFQTPETKDFVNTLLSCGTDGWDYRGDRRNSNIECGKSFCTPYLSHDLGRSASDA